MHVEFRLCDLSNVSLFDCQSFFRMKELMALQSSGNERIEANSPDGKRKLLDVNTFAKKSDNPHLCMNAIKKYKPTLRIQLVFEKLVKLESGDLEMKLEWRQHEKQSTTNFDGSDIQTKRFNTRPREVILTSLPLTAADCVIKMRLIQLAPDIKDEKFNEKLDSVLNSSPNQECHRQTPLCIGVAKITLKELMNIRGGVCIALQAKQTLSRLVEELNLNTVATNAMFGKDIGGSAFLTVQVTHYSFGKVPISKLLLNPTKSDGNTTYQGSENDNTSRTSDRRSHQSRGMGSEEADPSSQFDSPVVRFAMIPYIALADFLIRSSDAVSWRNPKKTLVLLLMVLLSMAANLLEAVIVVLFLAMLILTLRTTLSLYHVPPVVSGGRPMVSPLTSAKSPHVYLYGKNNTLFNALIRARLFFAQGLQKDAFYELALIIHTIRRSQRQIVIGVVAIGLSLFLLSVETLILIGIVGAFVVHPISLHFPISTRKQIKSDSSVVGLIIKAYRINKPMRVVRVVQVSVLADPSERRRSTEMIEQQSLSRLPSSMGFDDRFLEYVKAKTPSSAAPSLASSVPFAMHKRAYTVDYDTNITERQHQNASFLSFGVIVFKFDAVGPMVSSTAYNTTNRSANCNAFVRRLSQHYFEVKQMKEQIMDFQTFFSNTLNLLSYVRRQCTMQTFVSPNSTKRKSDGGSVRLDLFVRNAWLLEHGEDDGITTTLLETSNRSLTIEKLQKKELVHDDARSLALLAAHLLQGSRLSIYYSGSGSVVCSTILPLVQGSDRIERANGINPCPQPLFNTLEEIWRGTMLTSSSSGENPIFNIDTVLSIINTYRDSNKIVGSPSETGKNGPRTSFLSGIQATQRQSSVPNAHHHRSQSGQLPYGALTENRRSTFASPNGRDVGYTRPKREASEETRRVSSTLLLEPEEIVSPK
ncbi:hypothetical protein AGDE_14786 [Angomonas deanei]|nr:hypothetical protein AGDE_14786 [Angomonas deanei]|eukprot:EPY20227.1 hypothetical protein AGDE_14786 [Angomonas deanei]